MMFSKIKRLLAYSSKTRYVQYLRSKGMVVGNRTEFLSPIHSEVDIGRAKYITIGDNCILCSGVSIIAHDYSWKVLEDAYGEILPSGGMPINIGNNVFIGANSTIEQYCIQNDISPRVKYRICLSFEELVQRILSSHSDIHPIEFEVEYTDDDERAKITITYGKDKFDPADTDDELSYKVLKQRTEQITYTYDESTRENKVEIIIA